MTDLTKEEKKEIDTEIFSIIRFHLMALKMPATKENVNAGTVMFIEGVKYIRKKLETEQEKLLEGFSYKKKKNGKKRTT